MIAIKHITVDESNSNLTLEKYILKTFTVYNYIFLQKLIRKGQIRVNKKRIKLGYLLKTGDIIRIPIINKSSNMNEFISKKTPLLTKNKKILSYEGRAFLELINQQILYEDKHIIAINKPEKLTVQGGKNISISLNDLLPYIKFSTNINKDKSLNTPLKLIHRLDKNTTGVLLIAKTNAAAKHLFKQFKNHKIQKVYYCLVQGKVTKSGIITDKLLKINNVSNKCILDDHGKNAITLYETIYNSEDTYTSINTPNKEYNITFLKVFPKTGRNHQIRVHMGLSLNCPIIGDFKYGYKIMNLPFKFSKNQIFLHASSITFTNISGESITIKAPIGKKWVKILNTIGFKSVENI